MKPPFVLVHGAFRGGWSWSRVRPGLVAAGHDVHAPSLVGCGERYGEVEHVRTLDVWVDQLVRLLEAEDLHDVVLVSHSQAGIVTRGVAARVPERLRAVVHLDAALTDTGERAVDLTPGLAELPPRETWVPGRPLDTGGGLDEATVAWVNARLTPTPLGPSLDEVAPAGEVPEVVLFCAGTPQGYPSTVSRARMDERGEDYVLLDCGHDAPLEAPELVVEHLIDAASRDEVVRDPSHG